MAEVEVQTSVIYQGFVARLEDVSLELATSAHRNTSFSPERRGAQQQQSYVNHFADLISRLCWLASTPEKAVSFVAELERHREGYLKRLSAYLSSHSRVASTMITGGSNFPVRRNQKRSDSADRRLNELLEYQAWSERRIVKALKRMDAPVDRLEDLSRQLEDRESLQERMRETNKIIKAKKGSFDDKVSQLVERELLTETQARALLEPDYAGRLGFADYALTNNSASIRRIKAEIEKEEQKRQHAATTPLLEYMVGSVRVLENAEEDRLQVFFESKPDEAMRSSLKKYGFRWSPTQGAWQRQLTDNARYAAKQVLSAL